MFERLRSAKEIQAGRTKKESQEIPMLNPDTLIIVRYGPRDPKFFAKVIKDHGLTISVKRVSISDDAVKKSNQHAVIKVAKRHVYIPKNSSHELKNIVLSIALILKSENIFIHIIHLIHITYRLKIVFFT